MTPEQMDEFVRDVCDVVHRLGEAVAPRKCRNFVCKWEPRLTALTVTPTTCVQVEPVAKAEPVAKPSLSDDTRVSPEFHEALEHIINCHSIENGSNTPDFMLAEFMRKCLEAFNGAVQARDRWYGIAPEPGWSGKPLAKPEPEMREQITEVWYTPNLIVPLRRDDMSERCMRVTRYRNDDGSPGPITAINGLPVTADPDTAAALAERIAAMVVERTGSEAAMTDYLRDLILRELEKEAGRG